MKSLASWRTTLLGIVTFLGVVGIQFEKLLDSDPATKIDWNIVTMAVYALVNGLLSRDDVVSSEQAGAGITTPKSSNGGGSLPKFLIFFFFCFSLLLVSSSRAAEWYVSPSGIKATGNGLESNPWDFYTAIKHPASVKPGDTIWLKPGMYRPNLANRKLEVFLTGSVTDRITVRSVPQAGLLYPAIIDLYNSDDKVLGPLQINAPYTVWRDIRITSSIPRPRTTNIDGSWVQEVDRSGVVSLMTSDWVNCAFDNSNNGIFHSHTAVGGLIYGSLFMSAGWKAPQRTHGHGPYVQNTGVAPKIVELCVCLNQYNDGFNGYGTNESFLKNIQFRKGIGFGNGQRNQILAGETPIEDGVISEMVLAQPIGINGADTVAVTGGPQYVGPSKSLEFTNNYIVGAVRSSGQSIRATTYTGNTIIGGRQDVAGWPARFVDWYSVAGDTRNWTNNTYYGPGAFSLNNAQLSLSQWQAAGYDSGSIQITTPPPDRTFIFPNKQEQGRAHIAIINWSKATSAKVDLSSAVLTGSKYDIRSFYDPYGAPLLSGTYTEPVSIPLGTVSAPIPIGDSKPVAPADIRFQPFIVTSTPRTVIPPPIDPPIDPPPPVINPFKPLNGRVIERDGKKILEVELP